eukprot:TCALIF_06362-PA protein Name:"Similar to trpa-1 Transient receptor potential cation channel subfamily A member 1 homolog (Caenorhabditis elegans)" AED:0.12 eAED:0.12 QI:8/0.6/0.31/0.93/1/1/16/267/1355
MPNSGKVGPDPEVTLEIDSGPIGGRKSSEIGDLGDAFNFLFMGSNQDGLELLEGVSEADTIPLESLVEDKQDHLQVQNDVPPKAKRSKQRKKSVITYNSSRRPSLVDGILEGDLFNFQDQEAVATDKSLYQLSREGDYRTIANILQKIQYRNSNKLHRIVNQLDKNKISALHYAARYDHLDIVKLLVGYGANVNNKGDDGLTPLHFCARFKLVDRSALPTPHFPETVKDFNQFTEKIVGHAIDDELKAKVENSVIYYLVMKGAHINEKDKYGLTPLHYAAMRGNDEATIELIKCTNQIDIEVPISDLGHISDIFRDMGQCKDEQRLTPLHLACTYGQANTAKILLEHGANILSIGEKYQSALHKAAAIGNLELVEMLTAVAKATLNETDIEQAKKNRMLKDEDNDNNTPLLLAVESGSVDITRHLLDFGANVNHFNKARVYPLHLACTIGSLEIVKLLLHRQATINCINSSYQTPLLVASAYNHVGIIEYLLKKGAKIEKRDRDNFTPLLLAGAEGNAEAVEVLLKHGANIYAQDREDKSILYWAAAQNHYQAIEVLLKDKRSRKLLDACDRYDNSPLHASARKGYLDIVIALLEAGGDVDNKNEDEQTPLHLAAAEGRTRICKEILKRDKFAVNDEDSDSNTALHLASIHGHSKVVAALIESGADIEARNYYLWTPLDCAAAYGQPKCAKLLLDANAPIDPMDKNKTTPLHLAARSGHEKTVKLLIERGASLVQTNSEGHNALTMAILHGKKDVTSVIIDSKNWIEAMKSDYISLVTGVRETPLRLLIKQFPDLAKRVFDRCMITNLQSESQQVEKEQFATVSGDDPRFTITFNYELLDDAYGLLEDNEDDLVSFKLDNGELAHQIRESEWINNEIWDENHRLLPEAQPYSKSSTILKLNHPLMIMVKEKRTSLLGHPLCMALVRHKWNSFGRYVYYLTLSLYLLFVVFLTDFIINTPAPYSASDLFERKGPGSNYNRSMILKILNDNYNGGFGSEAACIALRDEVKIERRSLALVGKIVILALAAFHILKEMFQLAQARLTYIGVENVLEWACYITAILFVWDFTSCHQETGLRYDWQWQVGAFSITMTWLNLLSNVRKFPFLGIYVVMFTDVLQTFLKFSIICALFIIAFSLGFHALLIEQENFGNVWVAMMKTTVMMIGEFEFDDLFFDNISNSDENKEHMVLPYREATFLFFLVFMIIMSIIVMNLLVGLAVDDIKAVQDNAVLQRLAMQVTLNLDVEKILPEFIRRRFIVRQEVVLPNQNKSIFAKIFHDDNTLKRIAFTVVAKGNEDKMDRLSSRVEDINQKLKTVKEANKEIRSEVGQMIAVLLSMAKQLGTNTEELENETMPSSPL